MICSEAVHALISISIAARRCFAQVSEEPSCPVPYRAGSANFSRRKIGHAHNNSADSENVAGAHEPSVHAQFIFRFKNSQGNQSIFSTHDQNTAETSQPQAQPADG